MQYKYINKNQDHQSNTIRYLQGVRVDGTENILKNPTGARKLRIKILNIIIFIIILNA